MTLGNEAQRDFKSWTDAQQQVRNAPSRQDRHQQGPNPQGMDRRSTTGTGRDAEDTRHFKIKQETHRMGQSRYVVMI